MYQNFINNNSYKKGNDFYIVPEEQDNQDFAAQLLGT
jgi:hypothetical protein